MTSETPATPSSAPRTEPLASSASPENALRAGDRAELPSKRARLWGSILSGFGVLFLLFDASLKVTESPQAHEATSALGFPTEILFCIGVLQLILLALYLVPRTAVLGAVLWVGYLGGAVAIHVRVHSPLFSHTLFPVYVAVLLWGGLVLRDHRARALARDLFAPRGRGAES